MFGQVNHVAPVEPHSLRSASCVLLRSPLACKRADTLGVDNAVPWASVR